MMRTIIPHATVVANLPRNILSHQRSSSEHFGLRQYHAVYAAAKYHCSYSSNQYRSLDTRLLAPKPNLLCHPSSANCQSLQKYISSIRSENETRCSSSSYICDPTLRNVALLKYKYSTSNEKAGSRFADQCATEDAPKKLTVVQRFKAMLKDYWHVLVPVHIITSIGWFGGFYYLATSGMDIPAFMESLNFSEQFVKPFRDSSMGYIAVAYGLYKIATPVRYTVTVGGTSLAINILKKRGMVHPWPIHFKWLRNPFKKTGP